MSSDIETFLCIILNSDYMTDLIFGTKDSVDKYETEINILFGEDRFKNIKEIVELNNKHINRVIKEILQDEKEIDWLIKNTNITKVEIEEVKLLLS